MPTFNYQGTSVPAQKNRSSIESNGGAQHSATLKDVGWMWRREALVVENRMLNFEELVLPHLDAAYNLARWLTRNTQDAEDVVQEAYLRAFRFFDAFRGGNARTWLLTIVRNTCHSWLEKNRSQQAAFDEQVHTDIVQCQDPETLLLRKIDSHLLKRALEELPTTFSEILVLVELEELSYKQVAEMLGIPIGTVMSRLTRARHRLRESLRAVISSQDGPPVEK